MFSFFKKSKHHRLDDQVYISRAISDQGFLTRIKLLRLENPDVIALCFFEMTKQRIQPLTPDGMEIRLASDLGNEYSGSAFRSKIQLMQRPDFLFAEHHPHLEYENSIIANIETLCGDKNPSIGFYTSLEEPLMQRFGAQDIIGLMRKLGMADHEVINHSMVTKSIANAQRKIAKHVPAIVSAKSQEEWMSLNLPAQ